jgi:SMI1-KNR4 cell-wall
LTYQDLLDRLRRIEDKECGTGASAAEINEAEGRLGLAFPPDYRRLLHDFGWIQVGPTEIFGLGKGIPRYLDVVEMTLAERRDATPTLPSELLPVMNDGGGNLYCLNCNDASAPLVIWDHVSGSSALEIGFVDWLGDTVG